MGKLQSDTIPIYVFPFLMISPKLGLQTRPTVSDAARRRIYHHSVRCASPGGSSLILFFLVYCEESRNLEVFRMKFSSRPQRAVTPMSAAGIVVLKVGILIGFRGDRRSKQFHSNRKDVGGNFQRWRMLCNRYRKTDRREPRECAFVHWAQDGRKEHSIVDERVPTRNAHKETEAAGVAAS
jgi:hypothetical protein